MDRPALPRWKLALFGAIVVVLFFAVSEGLLALFGVRPAVETEDPYLGFAPGVPLYVEETAADGTVNMVTAPNKISYFNRQSFPKTKPANTVRIFTLGGSTTYGHPYDDRTSFSSWMREILRRADPSRSWEVVNAGGVSYASYRVANLMQELVRYQPDLFVVYSGQNEFLERRTYPKMMDADRKLTAIGAMASKTRTYSMLRKAVTAPRNRKLAEARENYRMTGEVDAVLDAIGGIEQYTRDDTLAAQIGSHYAFNLRRMARIAEEAGARILYVVPASNAKDCSPFKSEHSQTLAAEAVGRFDMTMARGAEALARQDAAAAEAAFREAVELDPRYAGAQYGLGRALLARGDADAAEVAFQRAIDEDVCPLRQPTALRDAIRRVVSEMHLPLVDYQAILEDSAQARTGSKLLGEEYFLDHVHPTIEANRIMAVAIIDAMAEQGMTQPGAGWQGTAVAEARQAIDGQVDTQMQALGLRNVARVFNWAGKTEEAGRLVRQAAELAPEDADNLVVLGSQAAAEKRYDDAIGYYERALAANPALLEARNNLAVELSKAGRYQEALAHYEKVLESRPDRWAVHSNAGYACLQMGNAPCAIDHYQRVVALRPEDAAAQVQLGRAYMATRDLDRAAATYRAAVKLDPKTTGAWEGLAAIYAARGEMDSSLAAFRSGAQAAPKSAVARAAYGAALMQRGELPAARTELEEAVKLDPRLVNLHNTLGMVRLQQGDLQGAVASFEEELRINPTHPDAPGNRAFIQVAQGDIEGAIRSYREALRAKPDEPKVLNGLAWLLATTPQDKYRNGREALKIAARADSLTGHRHPVALNTLAAAYAECGRFEDAIQSATRAAEAARSAGQERIAREIESIKDRYYSKGEPYHERNVSRTP